MSTSLTQDTFPLLSLPPELRQRIYGFCGPQHERFYICSIYSYPQNQLEIGGDRMVELSVHPAEKDSLPQLLRTCRQMNNEAKRLLYRNNIFEASRILTMRPWPKMEFFGPESQKEIVKWTTRGKTCLDHYQLWSLSSQTITSKGMQRSLDL